MQAAQARALTQAAVEALRRRDGATAQQALNQVVTAGLDDAATHLALAYAHAMLKDHASAHREADLTLSREPRNLRALLVKADLFHMDGDGAAAATFYQAAVKSVPEGTIPPGEMKDELARAQAMAARYQQDLQGALQRTLAQVRTQAGAASARFADSVGILLGEKQVYLQQPRHYFFPGLPHIQFYGRDQFPWLSALEAATADIRQELLAVLKGGDAFTPYVQRDSSRPALSSGGMLDNPDWSAYYLLKNGAEVTAHAQRCPRTMAALKGVPLTQVPGRSPSVLFSLLRPGAHIPAHNGMVNTRLICHLPLIVPPKCRFRVGHETRPWVEGQAWVFDDTIEHEAWNDSDQTRVVLLFEVWQPALTPAEQGMVRDLFAAIDSHPGARGEWGI